LAIEWEICLTISPTYNTFFRSKTGWTRLGNGHGFWYPYPVSRRIPQAFWTYIYPYPLPSLGWTIELWRH